MDELCNKYLKNQELIKNKKNEIKLLSDALKKEVSIIQEKNKEIEKSILENLETKNLNEFVFEKIAFKKNNIQKNKPLNIQLIEDTLRNEIKTMDKESFNDDITKNNIVNDLINKIEENRIDEMQTKLIFKKIK